MYIKNTLWFSVWEALESKMKFLQKFSFILTEVMYLCDSLEASVIVSIDSSVLCLKANLPLMIPN